MSLYEQFFHSSEGCCAASHHGRAAIRDGARGSLFVSSQHERLTLPEQVGRLKVRGKLLKIQGDNSVSKQSQRGRAKFLLILFVLIAGAVVAYSVRWFSKPRPGHVKDEALLVGRDACTFKAADEEFFRDMDG